MPSPCKAVWGTRRQASPGFEDFTSPSPHCPDSHLHPKVGPWAGGFPLVAQEQASLGCVSLCSLLWDPLFSLAGAQLRDRLQSKIQKQQEAVKDTCLFHLADHSLVTWALSPSFAQELLTGSVPATVTGSLGNRSCDSRKELRQSFNTNEIRELYFPTLLLQESFLLK